MRTTRRAFIHLTFRADCSLPAWCRTNAVTAPDASLENEICALTARRTNGASDSADSVSYGSTGGRYPRGAGSARESHSYAIWIRRLSSAATAPP